jgi:hypothetical protein
MCYGWAAMGRASVLWVALGSMVAAGCGGKGHAFQGSGNSPDGGSTSDGPSTGPTGIVTLEQTTDTSCGMPTYNGTLNAAFAESAASLANTSCPPVTMGECTVQVCETDDAGPSSPMGNISAGAISIKGTGVPLTLTPDPDGTYEPANTSSTMGPFLLPDSTITISASGAMVPSFMGTLSMGGAITLTSPEVSGLFAKVPMGAVPVTWTGGSATDKLVLFLSANSVTDASMTATIQCVFTGGSGTVPAAARAMLTGVGSFGAGPFATTSVMAGSFDVTMQAYAVTVFGAFME